MAFARRVRMGEASGPARRGLLGGSVVAGKSPSPAVAGAEARQRQRAEPVLFSAWFFSARVKPDRGP